MFTRPMRRSTLLFAALITTACVEAPSPDPDPPPEPMARPAATPLVAEDAVRIARFPDVQRVAHRTARGEVRRFDVHVRNTLDAPIERMTIAQVVEDTARPLDGARPLVEGDGRWTSETDGSTCTFRLAAPLAPGEAARLTCAVEGASVYTHTETIITPPPSATDVDYDQVADRLEAEIEVSAPEAMIAVDALLGDDVEGAISAFEALGGEVDRVLRGIGVLRGRLPAGAVHAWRARAGEAVQFIEPPVEATIELKASVPQIRANQPGRGAAGHPIFQGSPRHVVAVADTGINAAHPALGLAGVIGAPGSRLVAYASRALLGGGANAAPTDPNGHGTHVTGIIGQRSDALNAAGVAPQVSLAGAEACLSPIPGPGVTASCPRVEEAADWIVGLAAQQQLEVVAANFSLSGGASLVLDTAMRRLADAGIVPVAASGNHRVAGEFMGSPARAPQAIAVGAVNDKNLLAAFSEGSAPGESRLPDVVAPGVDINAARSGTSESIEMTGTSMATAHVSGLVALLADAVTRQAGVDDDGDGLIDEDPWDGLDNDGDGLIDEDPAAWPNTRAMAMRVKALILMATSELFGGLKVSPAHPMPENDPRLGEDGLSNRGPGADGFDRGIADRWEGHGVVNAGAAIDGATLMLNACGTETGTLGPHESTPGVWIRQVYLQNDRSHVLRLVPPVDADYDLHVYWNAPDADGNPVVAKDTGGHDLVSNTPGVGVAEELRLSPAESGMHYVVVRRVRGEGPFTLDFARSTRWTIMLSLAAEDDGQGGDLDAQVAERLAQLEAHAPDIAENDVQIVALVDPARATTGGAPGRTFRACIKRDNQLNASVYTGIQPIAEVDMGDPAAISDFVSWAVDRFPAHRYALFLLGNGHGWKSSEADGVGLGSDRHAGAANALTLAELTTGLADAIASIRRGSTLLTGTGAAKRLEVLGLDSPLMMSATVIAELASGPLADTIEVLLASQGHRVGLLPYHAMINAPIADPDLAPSNFALAAVHAYAQFFSGSPLAAERSLTAVRLADPSAHDQPAELFLEKWSKLSEDLLKEAEEIGLPDNARDNGLHLVMNARRRATELPDTSFVDLRSLVGLLDDRATPVVRQAAAAMHTLLQPGAGLVIAETHGAARDGLSGVNIYFPVGQLFPDAGAVRRLPSPTGIMTPSFANPFPSRLTYSAFPGGVQSAAHPRPSMTFGAPPVAQWGAALVRAYRPAAAACGFVGGARATCEKSVHAQIGTTVHLSARGSSDAEDGIASFAWWDHDAWSDSPSPLPAYPPTDPLRAFDQRCSEDCDRDGIDGMDDDPDSDGMNVQWICPRAGIFTHTVHVWDTHHREDPLHDETSHRLHWNVDTSTVTVHCSLAAYIKLYHGPNPSPRPKNFVADPEAALDAQDAWHITLDPGAESALQVDNPLPRGLDPVEGSLRCAPGTCAFEETEAGWAVRWRLEIAAESPVVPTLDYQTRYQGERLVVVNRAALLDAQGEEQSFATATVAVGPDLVCRDEADPDCDGVVAPADCAPGDASVWPGQIEACDGRDDDCDGRIDEGFAAPCRLDCADPEAEGMPCDDGDPCTEGTRCSAGFCGEARFKCVDGDVCTADRCVGGECSHTPRDVDRCDDGDRCTTGDRCVEGRCVGDVIACAAVGPCMVGQCVEGGCVQLPLDGVACDDADPCTTLDRCVAGVCRGVVPEALAECPDDGRCVDGQCVLPCSDDAEPNDTRDEAPRIDAAGARIDGLTLASDPDWWRVLACDAGQAMIELPAGLSDAEIAAVGLRFVPDDGDAVDGEPQVIEDGARLRVRWQGGGALEVYPTSAAPTICLPYRLRVDLRDCAP